MGQIGNCLCIAGCAPCRRLPCTHRRCRASRRSAPASRSLLWQTLSFPASALLLVLVLAPAAAAPSCSRPAIIAGIGAGGTLVLAAAAEGASEVVLAGIDIPDGTGSRATIAAAARRQLAELLTGQPVCLATAAGTAAGGDAADLDRYGRLAAQVQRADGLWVQGRLLAEGLARVHPTPSARSRIAEMLTIEAQTRADRRGLWRLASGRIQPADAVDPAATGLQIIEGRVLEAERRGDWWYLNFGADWRRDFTVTLHKRALPLFAGAGVEPFALRGKVIRVRGVLQWLNGPMIEVLVPEQIEIAGIAAG